jgi:hypothetical protein
MFIYFTKKDNLVEKQGVTGSKVDYQSIPYSSIKKFSKKVAILDLDAELKFGLLEKHTYQKAVLKDNNINEVYKILSTHITIVVI